MDWMSLYHGEEENPFVGEDKANARMWHGEMMFIQTLQNIADWKREAAKIRENRCADELAGFTDEELGIRLFIENLYRKCCPMEHDFAWIYQKCRYI